MSRILTNGPIKSSNTSNEWKKNLSYSWFEQTFPYVEICWIKPGFIGGLTY